MLGDTKIYLNISYYINISFSLHYTYSVDKVSEREKYYMKQFSDCVVTICTLDMRPLGLVCVIFCPMWCNLSTLQNGGDQEGPVDSSGSCFHCSCYSIAFPSHQAWQWTGLK